MRIAYLLGSLNRGGTETLLLDVFKNAGKSNLDAVGIYRKSGVLESNFLENDMPMYKVPTGKNTIGFIFQLRKLLLENSVTIVHAQQPIDALYAWLACAGTGIKVILTFHGYDFDESILGRLIIWFIIKRTVGNVFVSEAQLKHYQQKYHLNPDNQQVVCNGISFEKLEVSDIWRATLSSNIPVTDSCTKVVSPYTLQKELHLSSDTLLLGSVGNFVSGRDQLTLCRFLKLLNQQNLNFHFVFVGKRTDNEPQLYDDCVRFCEQNKLSDRVSFLGLRKDVPMILNELDAFIYATNHDTFGIAVVEAMAVGIPVFVNDWGVMSEITENGKYATLYKTKDENDLLQQFMLFLQNKAICQVKAKNAALFVRERYSIEKHIEALKVVYNKMINIDLR